MIQESWNDLALLTKAEELCAGRYPPRILFGKGILAEGWFQPYMPLRDYTTAKFLCDPETRTPVMVRFSAANGQPGSGDTARDLRMMEVKLYTKEGNCDLLSISLPECPWKTGDDVFDYIRTVKLPGPAGLPEPCGYLAYAEEHPRTLASILQLYGNRGIPTNYTCMESWGMGEKLWENSHGEQFLVDHHWVPEESPRYLSENEGEFLCGYDPDYLRRKLIHRVQDGGTAVFELQLTIWPLGNELRPVNGECTSKGEIIRAGRLVLEKVPENQMELEPVFCCSPDTLVPGMALVEGSFLHQLSLILHEFQRSRLGPRPGRKAPRLCKGRAPEGTGCPRDGYEVARGVWDGFGEEERRMIIKNMAQRLLFGSDDLQKKFLKEMENVGPEIAESIENQLIF